MTLTKRDVNEYLFVEFGFNSALATDQDVTDDWPFQLSDLGRIAAGGQSWQVFGFAQEDTRFFALANSTINFLPTAGMSLDVLAMQLEGQYWIGEQDPVSLDTTCGPESGVPSIPERRAAISALAVTFDSLSDFEVLEGLFLRARSEYVALIRQKASGKCHVVGDRMRVRNVPYPQASPWQRLSIGIGKIIRTGQFP